MKEGYNMETKVCTQCHQELPIEDFHWRNKNKGTRRSECKTCHNSYMARRNAENRKIIQALKQQICCKKCGESRSYLIDYHHIEPTEKIDTIARLMVHSSIDKALEEIKKCIPLCANCHREFHYFEKENGMTLEEYLA